MTKPTPDKPIAAGISVISLATLSGYSKPRLHELINAGELPAPAGGLMPTRTALRKLFAYTREHHGAAIATARLKRTLGQVRSLEIQNRREAGRFWDRAAAVREIRDITARARRILLESLEITLPLKCQNSTEAQLRVFGAELSDRICEQLQQLNQKAAGGKLYETQTQNQNQESQTSETDNLRPDCVGLPSGAPA